MGRGLFDLTGRGPLVTGLSRGLGLVADGPGLGLFDAAGKTIWSAP